MKAMLNKLACNNYSGINNTYSVNEFRRNLENLSCLFSQENEGIN